VDPGGTTHFYVRHRGDKEQTRATSNRPARCGPGTSTGRRGRRRAPYRFTNRQRLGNVAVLEAVVHSADTGRPEPVEQYS